MEAGLFDAIKENVSIMDMLQKYAPDSFSHVRSTRVGHKIPCPFAATRHAGGADSSPSAKFFPESDSIFCWACTCSWDVIAFYAEAHELYKLDDAGKPIPHDDGHYRLDYGKAASRLAREYSLDFKTPDWYARLKKTISVLKQPEQKPPAPNKVRDLAVIYETKFARPDTSIAVAAYAYVLGQAPTGSWVGVERDLHEWYQAAQGLLDTLPEL